jgi:DNA-binding MarR family transcriptional regulator
VTGTAAAAGPRDPDAVRAQVATVLARVAPRVTRRIRPTRAELAAGHFSTLGTLHRFGPLKPGELARVERVSAPTMTRIVTTLEDRGLVVRTQSDEDARCVTVTLTGEGEQMLAAARADQAAALAEVLVALDDAQVAAIAAALPALEAVARAASSGTEVSAPAAAAPGAP